MELIAQEGTHLILSLSAAFIGYIGFSEQYNFVSLLLIALLAGFFVDIDHLFDYFQAFGFKFRFDYFFKGYSFLKTDKIFVLFHSYELAFTLILLSLFINGGHSLFFTAGLSLFLHILYDSVSNQTHPFTYFFLFRLIHGFDISKLLSAEQFKKHLEKKKKMHL